MLVSGKNNTSMNDVFVHIPMIGNKGDFLQVIRGQKNTNVFGGYIYARLV